MSEKILAVIPHYNYNPLYLKDAVNSLISQTREIDSIVIVDDCSPNFDFNDLPKSEKISIYKTKSNVGCYAIFEAVFRSIPYDWFLIQDSDDISQPTRVANLYQAAKLFNASMVGSAIFNYNDGSNQGSIKTFDENASEAILLGKRFVLAWGSSMISRDLIIKAGGIPSGMRMSGDAEFIHRAAYVGKLINISSVELKRRRHPNSLTQHPDTGMGSPARLKIRSILQFREKKRLDQYLKNEIVDLSPYLIREKPVELELIHGEDIRVAY